MSSAAEWVGTVDPPDDPEAPVSCADCGALVLLRNVDLHVRWHDTLTARGRKL